MATDGTSSWHAYFAILYEGYGKVTKINLKGDGEIIWEKNPSTIPTSLTVMNDMVVCIGRLS